MTKKELAISEAKSADPPGGAFAAMRHPVFATLWVVTVLGSVGTFMRDVASGWLVTVLGITKVISDQENILEWFFVESWAEHLRQNRRVSKADAMVSPLHLVPITKTGPRKI